MADETKKPEPDLRTEHEHCLKMQTQQLIDLCNQWTQHAITDHGGKVVPFYENAVMTTVQLFAAHRLRHDIQAGNLIPETLPGAPTTAVIRDADILIFALVPAFRSIDDNARMMGKPVDDVNPFLRAMTCLRAGMPDSKIPQWAKEHEAYLLMTSEQRAAWANLHGDAPTSVN